MEWVQPKFSKSRVDRAGHVLASASAPEKDLQDAREIVSNWRAAHAFPLNTMQTNLRFRARTVDPQPLIAQRLKRETSLVRKLQRSSQMRLSQMQDIGGCRAVVRDMVALRALQQLYESRAGLHEQTNFKDYISDPPESGYRSVHFVHRYRGKQKREFDGLLIETQIRSGLQHAWATALEVVDTFMGTDLKSHEGPPEWQMLFAFISSAFAMVEETEPIPGTPTKRRELLSEIAARVDELGLLTNLETWSRTVHTVTEPFFRASKYILLDMRPVEGITRIDAFRGDELERAAAEYARIEREVAEIPKAQVVLVSAGGVKALKRSYPNYFVDTSLFVEQVRAMLPAAKGRRTSPAF